MKVSPSILINNQPMVTNIVSSVIDLQQVYMYSVQAYWAGPVAGDLKFQASNDVVYLNVAEDSPYSTVTHWSDIGGVTGSVSTGSGSSVAFIFNVTAAPYRWARMVWTAGSGSGTLNATICTKG